MGGRARAVAANPEQLEIVVHGSRFSDLIGVFFRFFLEMSPSRHFDGVLVLLTLDVGGILRDNPYTLFIMEICYEFANKS
ncbi:hypothetical protein KKA14_10555 [bacterium]|nr:hypothetical protein [bacterium]